MCNSVEGWVEIHIKEPLANKLKGRGRGGASNGLFLETLVDIET